MTFDARFGFGVACGNWDFDFDLFWWSCGCRKTTSIRVWCVGPFTIIKLIQRTPKPVTERPATYDGTIEG